MFSGSAGGSGEDNLLAANIELLAPLWMDDNSVFFVYPEVNVWDRDRQMMSIGAGFRTKMDLWPAIVGANVFYDHIEGFAGLSADQLGAGVEILTDWWDFRANAYFALSDQELIDTQRRSTVKQSVVGRSSATTVGIGNPFAQGNGICRYDTYRHTVTNRIQTVRTTQYYENFAQTMNGVDAELGVLVPWLPKYGIELRLYAGGYFYENPFGGGDLSGFKARAEARLGDHVRLDVAYHSDEEITGGHWFGGIRFTLPLGPGDQTPQRTANGLRPLSNRMAELIERNSRPVVATSGYQENESRREVSASTRTVSRTSTQTVKQTVADNVIFVNASGAAVTDSSGQHPNGIAAGSKNGDGTAQHPISHLEGALGLAADRYIQTQSVPIVYVQGGAANATFSGEFSLTSPVRLITSFKDPFGLNASVAPQFQGAPQLIGGFHADKLPGLVEITGWEITGSKESGITLANVGWALIQCNDIHHTGLHGVDIAAHGMASSVELRANALHHNPGNGALLDYAIGTMTGSIFNNTATANGANGMKITGGATQSYWNGPIEGNVFSQNGASGLAIHAAQLSGAHFIGSIRNNTLNQNNGLAGLEIQASGGGYWSANIEGNRMAGNAGQGAYIAQSNGTTMTGFLYNNRFENNGGNGLEYNAYNAWRNGAVNNNIFAGNTGNGAQINLAGTTEWSGAILQNQFTGNQQNGLLFGDVHKVGWEGFVFGEIRENSATSNGGAGAVFLLENADVSTTLAANTFGNNGGDGLSVTSTAGASWLGDVSGNHSNGNGGSGAFFEIRGGWTGDIENNFFNGNTLNGLYVHHGLGTMSGDIAGNSFGNNGVSGLNLGNTGVSNIDLLTNIVMNNGYFGMEIFLNGTWNGDIRSNSMIANNPASHATGAGFFLIDGGGPLSFNGDFQQNSALNNEIFDFRIDLAGPVTGNHSGGNVSGGASGGNSFTQDFASP
jgi:hypothetical protein